MGMTVIKFLGFFLKKQAPGVAAIHFLKSFIHIVVPGKKKGNAQYLFMGMAAIQFLKSFTPIVTACVTFVILGRKESSR
jgi:hypothetical protein